MLYRCTKLTTETELFQKVTKQGQQHTTTTILRPFVWDYPGEPITEETLTHPPSWSSSNLYRLRPSTTIRSILLVQITWLAIFLHNLFPCHKTGIRDLLQWAVGLQQQQRRPFAWKAEVTVDCTNQARQTSVCSSADLCSQEWTVHQ